MVEIKPACSNCTHRHMRNAMIAAPQECRLNPPSILIPTPQGDLMTVFPLVLPDQHCSHFKPKIGLVN